MANVPRFPITGSVLSHNVALDRVCLAENLVDTPAFPVGQYVFFHKNNSLWYRYMNIGTPWTNDIFYKANVTQSNVQFDGNGYPVVAYINKDTGTMYLDHYVNGVLATVRISPNGSYPNVLIDANDTWVVFVPQIFTSYLVYVQGCSNFVHQQKYPVTLPGTINNMNVEVSPTTGSWLFAFEVNTAGGTEVYLAST